MNLDQIRSTVSGRVIGPADPGYDAARTIFYGGFDRRPAAMVRVADADDVARVVTLAAETGTELAVRSGGHSLAGHSVTDGGIVIDLGDMRALDIDPIARRASAQTGLTTGEYTAAANAHGLATGFGDTGTVGIGGITLSGGIGLLVRKYGLTIDSLLSAEVVTADGRILHADADANPDLFWAIRGGGGNFGVVTRLKYRLHEVDGIVGGMMILPANPEVVQGFMAEAEAASEDLSVIVNVMVAPPMPFLPPEVHGKLVVFAMMAHVGDVAAAEQTIGRFRSLAEPLVDMVKPMPYPELFVEPEGAEEFHPIAQSHNMFIDEFDGDDARTIIAHIEKSSAMMSATQLRVLGGAVSRVAGDSTAFAHRHRRIMVNVAAMYMDPAEASTHAAWVKGLAGALRQGEEGAYIGFIADEGEEGARRAYPEATWKRLQEVKGRYDPTNLFHLNQNILPA
jgi:FAD/FMN-containing dehydrogenase